MDVCLEARQIVTKDTRQQQDEMLELLSRCESPVEQMLLATIYERWHATAHPEFNRLQMPLDC